MPASNSSPTIDNRVTLIIPAYNPGNPLIELVKRLQAAIRMPIVIVNDGSDDASRSIFEQIDEMSGVALLRHPDNKGKGAALKTAFRYVLGQPDARPNDYVVTVDADGQHAPEDIEAIVTRGATARGELVMGVRQFTDDIPLRSRFGNQLTRRVLRWVSRVELQDTQTGLRGLPLSFARESLAIEADRYEFELECILLAKQINMQIVEQPIRTIYIDGNAASHFRPVVDSLRIYLVFARYLLVSLSSFLLDIGLFTLFHGFGIGIFSSTYAARFLSGAFNFLFNKHLVFRSHDKRRYLQELIGYVLLAVLLATASGAAVDFFTKLTALHATVVKILVDATLFLISFLVQRLVVFRHTVPD